MREIDIGEKFFATHESLRDYFFQDGIGKNRFIALREERDDVIVFKIDENCDPVKFSGLIETYRVDESLCDSRSQIDCIGGKPAKTWGDYKKGCLMTFGGGYQTQKELNIFQHGMETVFNLLEAEFPPAEVCKNAVKDT